MYRNVRTETCKGIENIINRMYNRHQSELESESHTLTRAAANDVRGQYTDIQRNRKHH